MPTATAARRSLTLRYSRHNRTRKARFAVGFAERLAVKTVLLVGVSRIMDPHENMVENALMRSGLTITPTGIVEDVAGWDGYIQADGRDLPFEDQSFDLAYSNAVIEHVGGKEDQQRFVDELHRVGRNWIFTTPNRWFPIEAHSDVLFRHWRDSWYTDSGTVTRLLSPATLRELIPAAAAIHGHAWSPTLTVTCSRSS